VKNIRNGVSNVSQYWGKKGFLLGGKRGGFSRGAGRWSEGGNLDRGESKREDFVKLEQNALSILKSKKRAIRGWGCTAAAYIGSIVFRRSEVRSFSHPATTYADRRLGKT